MDNYDDRSLVEMDAAGELDLLPLVLVEDLAVVHCHAVEGTDDPEGLHVFFKGEVIDRETGTRLPPMAFAFEIDEKDVQEFVVMMQVELAEGMACWRRKRPAE